jgi:hypothetical protein
VSEKDEKALVPVEQKMVLFYGDEVVAVRVESGEIYVPVRPLCEALGIDSSAQLRRIGRDPVLSQVSSGVVVMASPLTNNPYANPQEMTCLPLDFLSGWLFGINANRVKEEIRDRLIRYQRECYKVLAEAFEEGRLTAEPDLEQLLRQADNEAVQAYQMAQAIVKLARNQLLMEARLTGRIDDHEERLEQIEITLGDPDRFITPKQASQISQAVKAVSIVYGKMTKRNEFGAVYGELYRKFDITAYKEPPAAKFRAAMDWLSEWYQTLTDDEVPF